MAVVVRHVLLLALAIPAFHVKGFRMKRQSTVATSARAPPVSIRVEDCGGADHIVKIIGFDPKNMSDNTTGMCDVSPYGSGWQKPCTTAMVSIQATISQEIAGGTFSLAATMDTGHPTYDKVVADIKGADICEQRNILMSSPFYFGMRLGFIQWQGLDCPVKLGEATILLKVTVMDEDFPYLLRNEEAKRAKVEIKGSRLDGKSLMCATLSLKPGGR